MLTPLRWKQRYLLEQRGRRNISKKYWGTLVSCLSSSRFRRCNPSTAVLICRESRRTQDGKLNCFPSSSLCTYLSWVLHGGKRSEHQRHQWGVRINGRDCEHIVIIIIIERDKQTWWIHKVKLETNTGKKSISKKQSSKSYITERETNKIKL